MLHAIWLGEITIRHGRVRGNVPAYHGPFLLHYLDAVVYPDIPANLLIAGAVAVCIMNLWIYARRLRVRRLLG